jgi:hypothetical protein
MEYVNRDQLQDIAVVTEQLKLPSGDMIPRLQWTIDAETGRPISRWVLVEKSPRGPV